MEHDAFLRALARAEITVDRLGLFDLLFNILAFQGRTQFGGNDLLEKHTQKIGSMMLDIVVCIVGNNNFQTGIKDPDLFLFIA